MTWLVKKRRALPVCHARNASSAEVSTTGNRAIGRQRISCQIPFPEKTFEDDQKASEQRGQQHGEVGGASTRRQAGRHLWLADVGSTSRGRRGDLIFSKVTNPLRNIQRSNGLHGVWDNTAHNVICTTDILLLLEAIQRTGSRQTASQRKRGHEMEIGASEGGRTPLRNEERPLHNCVVIAAFTLWLFILARS
ncbi:uncharacterized protein [Dermacentor albipictus]|uniref:uncharacterized protein n=1 Tax=Dermacentor albipictus TaxID=60249 RepID=UPI0038FCF90F